MFEKLPHLLPMQLLYKRFHPNNVWYCCGSVDESFYFLFSFPQTMGAEDKPGSKHDAAAERRERTQAVSSPQQKNRIRDLKVDAPKNFGLSRSLSQNCSRYVCYVCWLYKRMGYK